MIDYKTPEQVVIMQHGGHILADVLFGVLKEIKPGVSEIEIDRLSEK